ncbi:VCBS repeat-containing protein [Salmonirosea aquatica]|uniref:RNA-binding protein n=1 Tax=Salmonirosea aquatica TaxID=2654236 RepID=A0A7C9BCL7_9BACT|nr:RNA-binding protein [Cytophagaceae bacterium SJW1-29]
MNIRKLTLYLSLIALLAMLIGPASGQPAPTLFKLLPAAQTGIAFANQLTESDTLNILNQANIYNGGGVGIGDFNRDGLMDVYFAGNMVSNKLYLNQGKLKFTDITDQARVGGQGHWCTGVSVVDINGDGWPDIYLSASFRSDPKLRTNLLYINKGLNKAGVPEFEEQAAAYGLADDGFSTQAYFFDYDKDGDLDMYQVTNEIYDPRTPIHFRAKLTDGSAKNTDRLYRNNGNGTFSDVSKAAGITIEGWGHAAAITDLNQDGWPDIYVANDFVSNDLCFINNGDGTFTNQLDAYFKHTGWNAMGTDAVDINNDGYVDVISLEMLPENNLRKKRMLSGNEYYNYLNSAQYGYNHQYVRNVLQINSGPTPLGHPVFNDAAFMAGVYQTDWSWCPLVADFDNDGYRDLIITNGLPRDVTDLDYIEYNNGQSGAGKGFTLAMTDSLPVVKLANYAYRNTNGLVFENTTQAWGMDQLSFGNGAAYADLDNDGDLDVVVNNINDLAFVYENTLNPAAHHLTVSFAGAKGNEASLGANVRIYYAGNRQQFYEHQPARGYLSTDDSRAHFGLGELARLDSLVVTWPDGKQQLLKNVSVDKPLTLSYKDANARRNKPAAFPVSTLFTDVGKKYGLQYKSQEKDFPDFDVQPTLPHKLSQSGPPIAVGDIDNNGFDDFYVGGTSGVPGVFFMQDAQGKFTQDATRFLEKEDRFYEDMGTLLFDADNDGDLDLYLVSGSYEIPPGNAFSNDQLFLNNGKGKFTKSPDALPAGLTNGSCVKAADFDGDGDLDLFVGGRVVSGAYPVPPRSFLLRNDGGKFVDVTDEFFPPLKHIGLVTDALWSDYDNDGKPDLILTGEWLPVIFLKNIGTSFVAFKTGTEPYTGWWNSLVAGDFDNDGDMDYVAGNLGLNTNYTATPQEPMILLAKDIDSNGSIDPMVFCYMKADDGSRQPFPIASRDDLVAQVITMRKKFPTFKSYGLATLTDVWSESDRENALIMQATEMRSSYLENKGDGYFEMKPLPLAAQAAPIFGMKAEDVDGNGTLDLVLVGNDYGMDPNSGRHDAFNGLVLQGDGKGNFSPMPVAKSGFFVPGDAKSLATLHTAKNEDILLATQNQDSLVVFGRGNVYQKNIGQWIKLKADDFSAEIEYKDGSKRRVEFSYGDTYLSQSSRQWPVGKNVRKIAITNFQGKKRVVD